MDNTIMNQQLEENQNLVHEMINQMLPSQNLSIGILAYDDLFQEGLLGLWKAYKEYDSSREVKFSTFACIQIKYAILNCLNKQQFRMKYPYSFKTEEKKNLEDSTLFLNQTAKGNPGEAPTELIDTLQGDTALHSYNANFNLDEALDVRDSLSVLNEKERRTVEKYYFEDKLPKDIAKEENITRQAVELRKKSGLKKLRTSKQLAYA